MTVCDIIQLSCVGLFIIGMLYPFFIRPVIRKGRIKAAKKELLKTYEEIGLKVYEDNDYNMIPSAKKEEGFLTIYARSVRETIVDHTVEFEFDYPYESPWGGEFAIQYKFYLQNLGDDFKEFKVLNLPDKITCEAPNEQILYALLDAETRKIIWALHNLTEAFAIIELNTEVHLKNSTIKSRDNMLKLIELGRSLASRIHEKSSITQRLSKTALTDPQSEYRGKAISLIGDLKNPNDFDKKLINETLINALKDSELKNQIKAAAHLGDRGFKHVIELIMEPEKLNTEEQNEAVLYLLNSKKTERIGLLVKLYNTVKDDELCIMILDHFEKNSIISLSDQLCKWLKTDKLAIKLAVIRSLGACGDIKAVEHLYNLEKDSFNMHIDKQVRRAIASIQSREGIGEKGQLSISEVDNHEGALSIDENEDI